jgi:pimeloyl-ACP methyl ester carboxylesterase
VLTLLLLPGMDGTGEFFDAFVKALHTVDPDISTVVVRYPTHQPLGYADLEAIARAAIPSDGDYLLLGESFSGPIAIALAAAAPPRLKGLVLCASFARNPGPTTPGLHRLFTSARRWLPMALAPVRLMGHLVLGRFSTRELRAALARSLTLVAAPVLRHRLREVMDVDATAQLKAVPVPLLYLRASFDRVVPPQASAHVAANHTNAQIVEIDAPHFLLQARPDESARAVGAFIRGLQG